MSDAPRCLAALLVLAAALGAQADDEPGFLKKQGAALEKHAEAVFKAGYPSMARNLWLEVLSEYDKDNADARKSLGFVKFRDTWTEKEGFVFPEGDNVKAAAAKKIEARWAGVARSIGGAHKKIAGEFRDASRADRADYHFRRALRFLPEDQEVRAAVGHKEFGGMSGTTVEEVLFNRSKMMEAAVNRELKQDYPVEAVTSAPPEFVTKAGIQVKGFKSERFTIWGEFPDEVLQRAAVNAERALAFCKEAFVGGDTFKEANVRSRTMVFVNGKANFNKVLDTSPQLVPNQESREFIKQNATMTRFNIGGKSVRFGGPPAPQVVQDAVVRFVTQEYSSLRTDGMTEGIGHAVVGMFFGQNLIFNVAQNKGRTVTNYQRKLLLPDMDTWVELAIDTAFDPRGTKAAQLPLIKAGQFPTDGRIKAWSFCDYLLRRNATLLVYLDRAGTAKNPGDVAKAFKAACNMEIDALEQEWKDFWTGATPVLRALRMKKPVLDSISKDAEKWLKAFNKLRKDVGKDLGNKDVVDLKWSAGQSSRCKQHVEFLAANKSERGPGLEHMQRQDKEGATPAGSAFAALALVSTLGSPARGMKDWLDIPGYRDALINPYLRTAGVYADGPVAVIDVVRGVQLPERGGQARWFPTGKAAPREIAVKVLGPEVQRELEERKIKSKTIGYPLTYHTWVAGNIPADTKVEVRMGKDPVEGFVIINGHSRYTTAPGMLTFYPLEPFKSGQEVRVTLDMGKGRDGKDRKPSWSFTCK